MLALVDPHPVGLPGLAALVLGFVLFLIALAVARFRREPSAEPAGQTKAGSSWIGVAITGVAFFIASLGPLRLMTDPSRPEAIVGGIIVLALVLFTLAVFIASTRAMGRNWAVVARTRSDHQLVTDGPFAYVRNPIYSALFVMLVAMAVGFGHWRGFVVAVPIYWIGTMIRVRDEERLLRAQFGPAYDAYAARVRRFVPGII